VNSRKCLAGAVFLSLLLAAVPLHAADGWQEAAGGAVAILPAPTEAKGIVGGSLYCAEQKWGLLLRLAPGAPAGGDSVRISVQGEALDFPATASAGALQVALPADMLEPLKQGSRMKVAVAANPDALRATFALRNSGKVIEAIAPRCSQVDMSAYEAVSLLELRPAVDEARKLFAAEIALFREATKKEPVVAAAEIGLADGKRLLFGSLCGSTWYYGVSGCTLYGWAIGGTGEVWRQVYESDGATLYLDRKTTSDGWPALVTLAAVNGADKTHWLWSGSAYAVEATHVAADEDAEPAAAAQ